MTVFVDFDSRRRLKCVRVGCVVMCYFIEFDVVVHVVEWCQMPLIQFTNGVQELHHLIRYQPSLRATSIEVVGDYICVMKRFSTKIMKFAMALTVSMAPILLSVSAASASCTVTVGNYRTNYDPGPDIANQISYWFSFDCSEKSGEYWSKVSTSNVMSDTAGGVEKDFWDSLPDRTGRYGKVVVASQTPMAAITYFVQAYVRTSSGTYSSKIIATTTPAFGPTTTMTTSSFTTVPSSGGSSSSAGTTAPSKVVTTTTALSKVVTTTTTTTQIDAVEDDGDDEEDFADVGISKKDGRFDMRVSSSFLKTEMVLRAYKKGSKSVTWSFTTYSSGNYRIITSRALKGFTVSLWIDGEKWDSLVVR